MSKTAMSHTAGLSACSLNLPFAVASGQADPLHLKARPRTFNNHIVTHQYTLENIAPDPGNMIASRKLHTHTSAKSFSSHYDPTPVLPASTREGLSTCLRTHCRYRHQQHRHRKC